MKNQSGNSLLQSAIKMAIPSLLLLSSSVHSLELYKDDATSVDAKLTAAFGIFSSREKYAQTSNQTKGSTDWQEATFQYGLDVKHTTQQLGSVYGALNWVSSGTWGEGDAAGWTMGGERTTKIEDAYAGWKSGNLFPVLGEDGVEVSFGRQNIVVGDGFIISGDALNIGEGLLDGRVNRGGAYYLTGRKNFDQTAVLRLGGADGLRGDLIWLKSDNRAQAEPETIVATLENVAEKGTVGLTAVKVVDTSKEFADDLYPNRKNMKIYSVRAKGDAGVPGLFLAGEYAKEQKNTAPDENAWYLEAGWTFNDAKLTPKVNYRYSRFSEGYDPLFYGNGRELGTWFQGEVASNYAGPFSSNATIQQVGLKLAVTPTFSAGALLYKFDTISTNNRLDLSGKELNIYGEWAVNDHLLVLPLVGFYKPEHSAEDGGTQLGSDRTNVYAQLLLVTNF
ncbi:hypothetical protein SRABI70_00351 [Pseudomonas sp. Bi70]|uniref:alginate export family protein n=1 Tax=Pseudomonas sp. Bi70 TaxID=2821127 RepID=UPI001DCF651A|nr:alginate export family protein [Pseudomonas sp. Bi70]CAH0143737.1 hypothetical protein SRABI70_00351 [Pseudomonas sp. Bi70]